MDNSTIRKYRTVQMQEHTMSENKTGEIVIYQTNDGQTNIDVRFEDETVCLHRHNL